MNVRVLHIARQYNGNSNDIGIMIRDHRGRMVRGSTRTIRGLSTLATQLWAIHVGLNQDRLENCELVVLEKDNFNPYFEITHLDSRGDKACLWIVE